MDAVTDRIWPAGLTRIPYWVYTDPDVLALEQKRVFEGPVWSFLCLETELSDIGDFRTTFVGRMPVVVVRAEDREICAFENRCAHRGALIALDDCGSAKDFQCVYHSWRYDLRGNLRSIAFSRGVNGRGGMPADFDITQHGPRKLRVATFCGMVFGTLSPHAPEFETWLGPEIVGRVRRVLGNRRLEIIGRFTQALPNNWKLYFENVRDTYHASLLHLFFATFRITRLSSGGGVLVSETGEHHASATLAPPQGADSSYQGLRSEKAGFRLADPSFLGMHDEFHDDIQLQILSIFPGFVLQQVHNALAVRQIVPRGVDATDLNWTYLGFVDDTPELRAHRLKQNNLVGPAGYVSMEDGAVGGFVQRGIAAAADELSVVEMGGSGAETQETRATESSVRGFYKAYRTHMGALMGDAETLFRLATLNTKYASCIDADRLEEWPGLFLEQCLYRITTADNHRRGYAAGLVYADSRAMLTDRVAALREANIYERQSYRHIVGMPALRPGDDLSAETPFVVVRTMRDGRMDLFAAGVYLDRVRDDEGSLRFAERIVVCDSSRIDTLLAIPL